MGWSGQASLYKASPAIASGNVCGERRRLASSIPCIPSPVCYPEREMTGLRSDANELRAAKTWCPVTMLSSPAKDKYGGSARKKLIEEMD